MLIIIDKKAPAEAKKKLMAYGTLLELETEGVVYPAISGHPDIFFCKSPQTLFVSKNLPPQYFDILKNQNIEFVIGQSECGRNHPDSIHYNAAMTGRYLVHRLEFTDPVILQHSHFLNKISVKQAYTRCNLFFLKENQYITSDHGIHLNLQREGLNGIYVSPAGILLPGFPNGFVGGTMGLSEDTVFVMGNLDYFQDGVLIRNFIKDNDHRLLELYDGQLIDGGGLLFI